jgi:anti-sigma regulatory factor (Ser/Thr protein kinase)
MTPPGPPVLAHGFRVEAEDSAVPQARHTITALVRSWNVAFSEEQVAQVELLSAEVITNAIHHTQAPCSVSVQWNGVRVRVEVTDTSPVRPKRRQSSPDAEGGRGLVLVDALAADWGSVCDAAGKVVWFEVASSIRPARREQPPPWSTPGTWAITTTDGAVISGYLPAWAEDDPTEVGVPPEELPQRLAQVDHRAFFEGPMLPVTAPDLWDGAEEDSVFEGSIDCNPHDPDPRLRIPVANLQISVGRWILGLDPDDLADIAAKLRAHADLLDHKIRPALTAARNDWAVHHPQ